ncbi:hypothetical protein Rhopal_007051-T1 [Rhodotorula paludigena]|uniref:Amino acid transporter transmembrane domain-containing protein n=1 Tax=Rhodotorula paludigena TaxID=86838 RepID=A0AAV5GUQ4_9BASI|nr:hypothetical protein Rhopal_007051-T1 [Rhodotorula paludigena]
MFRSREPKGQEINDEKTVSQAVASVQDEETIGQQDRLQPAVADAFALREGDENQVDFKTLGWIKAGLIITCEAIALGTLSFPSTFKRLGLAAGLITNCAFIAIAYLGAWIMVDFKLKYPHVLNAADAGREMFGRAGYIICGIAIVAKSVGLAASHVLAGKLAIATFDDNANCAVGWAALISGVSAILSYNRKWSGLLWLSVASLTCIIIACIVTMAGAGTQPADFLVPPGGEPVHWVAFNTSVSLADCIGAITNCVFAYGQAMAVLTFLPEMKKPKDFRKSIALMQVLQLIVYSVVGGVLYTYGGQYTPSPALTMTKRTLAIISYAFALVTIIVSGIVAVNVGAKFFYTELFRNSPMLTSNSWKAQGAWLAIIGTIYTVAFIIAELIPFFNQLLTIVSSWTSSWFVCGFAGMLWLHLYNPRLPENAGNGGWFSTPGRIVMFCISIGLVAMSASSTV